MRIRMLRDRLFRVPSNRRKSFEYLSGRRYTVKRDWGAAMVAAGDAEEVEVPAVSPPARRRRAAAPE